MAATPSVKIVKSFSYRGETKLWSNRYHMNGGSVPDQSHFNTLADAIVTAEKAIYKSDVTIVSAVYYAAGSDLPVYSKSYSTAGTLVTTGMYAGPGDAAALLRYSTAARTAKNHPVYLYNYYHRPMATTGTYGDSLDTTYVAAINTYAGSWMTGFSDGATTYVRAGPNGATATGHSVNAYFRHRDLRL